MKLDEMTYGHPLAETAEVVATARDRGYDGWFVSETVHDPFLAAAVAGTVSGEMQIGTAIAVAFPRSPMHVAYAAHDLQALTGGRFVLGLGSQIKPHIEKRFSSEWSKPAARMREYVLALPGHLARLADRGTARLPGGVHLPHPHDALLHPAGPRPPGPAGVAGGGRAPDDPGHR
jgi:alkanesulfonate monooxygenase SsuD/methylene tetrahydromethanopterin reductase-like flavin-dependent oxidoreductase (luciferase family)